MGWFEDAMDYAVPTRFLDSQGQDPLGFGAAEDAYARQAQYIDKANQVQGDVYNSIQSDLDPWQQSGVNALSEMGSEDYKRDFTMADYEADPGYQFRMDEGMKSIQGNAAARGLLNSGATLKELTRYGQDVASQEYQSAYDRFNADRDRRYDRLNTQAGYGQNANSMSSSAGQNYANQVSQNYLGQGNAAGAAAMGQQNTMMGLLNLGAQGAGAYFGAG